MKPRLEFQRHLAGVLLGTAVGDALGLPAEGLSKSRIARRWQGRWRHRLVFGRGLCSDDTEHTFFVAQALLAHPADPAAFQRSLAWKLQFWLAGFPAGIGLATLRSILKLWCGISPARSGVKSAGNGPAMRSAILGAWFHDDPAKRREFVSAATRLTHTDPRAETAALAVAEAAAWAVQHDRTPPEWFHGLMQLGDDEEWRSILRRLSEALRQGQSVGDVAVSLGLGRGVSGYCYHSVPVALYAWARHPHDFRSALVEALNCGGDTDTVGAMVGALAGAAGGPEGIPSDWLDGICEWPRSLKLLAQVAERLAAQKANGGGCGLGPVRYFWPGLAGRNLLFLVVVLAHGFGRLLPRL